MYKKFQLAMSQPLGGPRETRLLLAISLGVFSAFPPLAGLIDRPLDYAFISDWVANYCPPSCRVTQTFFDLSICSIKEYLFDVLGNIIRVMLIAMALYASYELTNITQRPLRNEHVLSSNSKIESSDPPEYPPGTPGLLFGYSTDDGSPIYISDEDLVRHGIIIGQTGVGKSVLGKTLMFQQIQRGGGLLFIDGKLDSDNIQDIYEYCVYCGRGADFLVVNPGQPEKSNTYNPILFGDPDEVAARIISLIPESSSSAGADYYKQSASLARVCFLSALQEQTQEQVDLWTAICKKQNHPPGYVDYSRVKGRAYNFLDLALLTMNEGVLNSLMDHVRFSAPKSLTRKNLSIFLEQYARENISDGEATKLNIDLKRLKETLGGIGARMHSFGSGNFGPVLNSYNPEVKMYEAIKNNKVVYLALPTMGKDVAAQNLGKIAIADLRTSISWLQMNKQDRPKIPFLAFLDEMSSYSTETLAVMFEQARSARVALFPAIQTDSGLTNISEDFKERIMANTELKIFFRLSSQETALTASDLIGETRRITETSSVGLGESASAQALDIGPNKALGASENESTGEKEEVVPLVHQDEIKALQKGECVILRSPRVWCIKIPMIELTKETKAAIGPLRIHHGKNHTKSEVTFDAMNKVDDYIAEAQRTRVKKPKVKKENTQQQKPSQPEDPFSDIDSETDEFKTF
jgi:hypothetical protein